MAPVALILFLVPEIVRQIIAFAENAKDGAVSELLPQIDSAREFFMSFPELLVGLSLVPLQAPLVLPVANLQPGGGPRLVVLAVRVFAFVQLVESWLLTPNIMANRSGLPPALVVISVFFRGIAFGGVTGMILAVPLTAFFVTIWGQIKLALKRGLSPVEKQAVAQAGFASQRLPVGDLLIREEQISPGNGGGTVMLVQGWFSFPAVTVPRRPSG